MVFSSLTFLLWFLPCVLLVYFLVPKKAKNAILRSAYCFMREANRYMSG